MKTSFLTENLQKKLPFLNHAVSGKTQLPILSNFLLEAEKGKLKISATDLEIGIVVQIPANNDKDGSVTVPARTFSDLVTSLSKGKATLELKENNLELKGEKVKTVFQTMPTDDFPRIYEDKGDSLATLKKEVLDGEFSKVMFAASQDSGRPALSGVFFKKEDGGFLLVSTDGYRLSLKKEAVSVKNGKKEDRQLLVPARVIKEAVAIKEDAENVEICIAEKSNQILFFQGDTVLVGRLIEAEYPAYEKIIPTDASTKSFFEKEQMQNAVKICSVFARETANIVKFSVKKDKIIVSANTPSVGENTVEIDAKTSGEENEIAFNARYLLDLFANLDEEDLIFEMTGPLNPGVFKIKDDPTFLHLIMPIRVQS